MAKIEDKNEILRIDILFRENGKTEYSCNSDDLEIDG